MAILSQKSQQRHSQDTFWKKIRTFLTNIMLGKYCGNIAIYCIILKYREILCVSKKKNSIAQGWLGLLLAVGRRAPTTPAGHQAPTTRAAPGAGCRADRWAHTTKAGLQAPTHLTNRQVPTIGAGAIAPTPPPRPRTRTPPTDLSMAVQLGRPAARLGMFDEQGQDTEV